MKIRNTFDKVFKVLEVDSQTVPYTVGFLTDAPIFKRWRDRELLAIALDTTKVIGKFKQPPA